MHVKKYRSVVWTNATWAAIVAVLLLSCGGSAKAHGYNHGNNHGNNHRRKKHAVTLKTWHFPHGLAVTYVPTPPSDLAELVDAHLWKFRLHLKKPYTGFICKLEWREEGKPPRIIALCGAGPSSSPIIRRDQLRAEVKIGIVPLGLSIQKSASFKWRLFNSCDGSSGSSDGYENYSYKGPSFDIVDSNYATDEAGEIPLMVFWTTGDGSPDDDEVFLVLVITAAFKLP